MFSLCKTDSSLAKLALLPDAIIPPCSPLQKNITENSSLKQVSSVHIQPIHLTDIIKEGDVKGGRL